MTSSLISVQEIIKWEYSPYYDLFIIIHIRIFDV
jgi:hypothetical protein